MVASFTCVKVFCVQIRIFGQYYSLRGGRPCCSARGYHSRKRLTEQEPCDFLFSKVQSTPDAIIRVLEQIIPPYLAQLLFIAIESSRPSRKLPGEGTRCNAD